jgi:hypothetical protein
MTYGDLATVLVIALGMGLLLIVGVGAVNFALGFITRHLDEDEDAR